MTPLNPAQSSTVTTKPTTTGGTPYTPARVIREAEKTLKLAGFHPGKVDGKPTAAFTEALTAFQKAWGLPETGVVDAATLSKLRHTNKRIHNHDGKGDKFVSIGQQNARIEDIEKKLRALGYDPGKVDGVYDRETAEAVKAFKRDQPELKNTYGFIGNAGQAALAREVKALKHAPERRRIKPTKGQLRLDVKTAKAAAQGLQEGSRGAAVKNIQKHLKAAGFDPQHTNGIFDERTGAALKAFQRRSGLEPTGTVDAKTWNELKKSYILAKGAASPAQARGERSGAVRSTEKLLKSLGYHVKVDGFFDARTERAVKSFEKKHHLKVDGNVTTGELAKLKKAEKASHGLHVTNAMRRLARAGKSVALSMGGYQGTGYCATGVSRAIARALGLSVHGNGNQIDNNLPRKHFRQIHIPLSQALKIPGLILTWERTSSAAGQKYGHTAITLGNGRSSASDFVEYNTLGAGGRSGLKIFIPV